MSTTDYIIIVIGAYGLYLLSYICKQLKYILVSVGDVQDSATVSAKNSVWMEQINERLTLIEMHSESIEGTLMYMVTPQGPSDYSDTV